MKKSSFLILGLTLVLSVATPFSVYAQDMNGNDLVMMEETDFEKMIAEIISIKSENPEITEGEVLQIMDEQVFGDVGETRGITDLWNTLTESEKGCAFVIHSMHLRLIPQEKLQLSRLRESLDIVD